MNPADQLSFIATLGAGVVGGLILNVMPCVLPGVFFKIQKMIQQVHAGGNQTHRRLEGLAFLIGMLISFTVLGLFVIVLKSSGESLGWGMQMQNATFVGILMLFTLLFALNSLELFIIQVSFQKQKSAGLFDAVLEGVFISLISIPCSAPILGTAITLALAQDTAWWKTMLLFWSIALGLASPILLVSFTNFFAKLVPKPGMWTEHFKKIVGISLLAATVWLYTQFKQLVAPEHADITLYVIAAISSIFYAYYIRTLSGKTYTWLKTIALSSLPIIGIFVYIQYAQYVSVDRAYRALYTACLLAALWTASKFWTYSSPLKRQISSVLLMMMSIYAIYWASQDPKIHIKWQPYEAQTLKENLQQGRPVFVDFTADWCQSCKFFEAFYLNTAHTADLFEQHKIVAMQVDLTAPGSKLWDLLKSFNRSGIPAYVLYHPNGQIDLLPEGPPLTLPEKILTLQKKPASSNPNHAK
jgi:thiol:disulfide interchange protein